MSNDDKPMDGHEKRGYYESYRRLFIHDELRPSLRDFARKHNMADEEAFIRYAKREDWEFARDGYQEQLGAKVEKRMLEMQSFDLVAKLREIQAMKTVAWEAAIKLSFKNAKDAVSSYVELEKLERLIQGQSTENISMADVSNYMEGVAAILLQELRDESPVALMRIQTRLEQLTFGNAVRAAPGADHN